MPARKESFEDLSPYSQKRYIREYSKLLGYEVTPSEAATRYEGYQSIYSPPKEDERIARNAYTPNISTSWKHVTKDTEEETFRSTAVEPAFPLTSVSIEEDEDTEELQVDLTDFFSSIYDILLSMLGEGFTHFQLILRALQPSPDKNKDPYIHISFVKTRIVDAVYRTEELVEAYIPIWPEGIIAIEGINWFSKG